MKIYIEMKKRYEEVKGLKLIYEYFIKEFLFDVKIIFLGVMERMMKMKFCRSRFKEIVLKLDYLFMVEYLDFMI